MQAHHILRLPTPRVADSIADAATRLTARLLAAWQRRRLQQATVETLRSLGDRTLHDLGLHRCEIVGIAAEIGGDAEATYLRTELACRPRY